MAFRSVSASIRSVGAISPFPPIFRFSTSGAQELCRAFESDINHPDFSLDVECPFEIQNRDNKITLARKYQDEHIELRFTKSLCYLKADPPIFPMSATIYKKDQFLHSEITATSNKVDIHTVFIRGLHLDAFEKCLEDRGIIRTMKLLFDNIDDVDVDEDEDEEEEEDND